MAGALAYVPYREVGDTANVMADGAPLASTVLTLSHWPGTPTPRGLWADLSVEIALRWRDGGGRVEAGVATADHYDQDGLATLAVLVDPALAADHRRQLVAVASAGDFSVCADRDAARVAMALGALAQPEHRPEGDLHAAALAALPGLLRAPAAHRHLWAEEDEFLARSEAALAGGAVTIVEHPEVDLAVVRVVGGRQGTASQFARGVGAPIHPMAVHNRTARSRILTLAADRAELVFRYETWVRLASRRPPPRIDVAPLAAELSAEEPGATRWSATGASALVAKMSSSGPSELAFDRIAMMVVGYLASRAGEPPAWDPYR